MSVNLIHISKLDVLLDELQARRIVQWEKDLCSGKFLQARGVLQDTADDNNVRRYCCLGVAATQIHGLTDLPSLQGKGMLPDLETCKLFGWKIGTEDEEGNWLLHIPEELLRETMDIRSYYATSLNDRWHFSFNEIAQCIRYTYSELFQ